MSSADQPSAPIATSPSLSNPAASVTAAVTAATPPQPAEDEEWETQTTRKQRRKQNKQQRADQASKQPEQPAASSASSSSSSASDSSAVATATAADDASMEADFLESGFIGLDGQQIPRGAPLVHPPPMSDAQAQAMIAERMSRFKLDATRLPKCFVCQTRHDLGECKKREKF